MKIRIDIEDKVYRRAKAEAARRGCSLDRVIEEGLRIALAGSKMKRSPRLSTLVKRARGVVRSGVPDLGSNKAHFKGFGRS